MTASPSTAAGAISAPAAPAGPAARAAGAALRVDLHCHSKHSDRSDEWVLRALAAPESVMEPREIYRLCRQRGMDLVTISDHDRIEGALEIAHLPGTFLSSEVTVAFPEDGCQIHCLVIGIDEAQHREIQRLRGDLYAFRDYTEEQGIVTSVAHPFYRVNGLLTVDHLERLFLLFERFEARNGIHDGGGNALVEEVVPRLTPSDLECMAERQDLAPRGVRPWVKHLTGGSDDHGGLYVATTWTEVAMPAPGEPGAAAAVGRPTVEALLAGLRSGASRPGGAGGSTHRLTQSIYSIANAYCERDLGGRSKDPFRDTLRRLGLPEREPRRRWFSLPGRHRGENRPRPEATTVRMADRAVRSGVRRFLVGSALHLRRGNLAGGLRSLAHLAPAAGALLPYLFAAHAQHKDGGFVREARRHFTGRASTPGSARRAWVTDTFGDVNGVARTVETVARRAAQRGLLLTVLTCRRPVEAGGLELRNFPPILDLPLPGYPSQKVALPPLMEVYREMEAMDLEEVLISTPGPLGLVARTAARLLGIRCSGIYHTDFPAYLGHLLGDDLVQPTWAFMRWFYGDMERIWVRSLAYRDLLVDHGFDARRIRLMPRAVDTAAFRPSCRDPAFWPRHGGAAGGFRFLYVGRVSKEKNLDALLAAFDGFLATGRRAELAVVGDGPYREELRRCCAGRREVLFPGVLRGEALSAAYASADLFAFPSLTDTLGNAVLEAQASGLAAVVTDRGGPRELVRDGLTGLVVPGEDVGAFTAALVRLHDDRDLRTAMGKQGAEAARRLSWDGFLDELWREAPEAVAEPVPAGAATRDDIAAAREARERVARVG